MYDPQSPFNDAKLSELIADPAAHDHLDAWLAHLHGYTKIEHGPYVSTHGMKHNGWSGLQPRQARRVAVPNYTTDWNALMPFLLEAHTRLAAGGGIRYVWSDGHSTLRDLGTFCLLGPDGKNGWEAEWFDKEGTFPLFRLVHFEPTVAIAAAIITALEGQAAALAQSNITQFARSAPSEISNLKFSSPSSSVPSVKSVVEKD